MRILSNVIFLNTGLRILDTNASHSLILAPGSNLTADHTLTITTGDADRTLTLSGDATISGTNSGDQSTFSTIVVAGQSNVVADSATDTLTLVAGTNITLTTDASTDTITITAAGGTGVTDGATLSTGLTFPNTGLHILDTNASHDLIIAPGSDLTADHTLTITTGDADRTLTLSGNATLSGGTHSGTNTGDQSVFSTIAVSGQSDVVADSATDTLTLVAGTNITITTNATTDSITITAAGGSGVSFAVASALAFVRC